MAVVYNIQQPLEVLAGFTVEPITGTQAANTYDFMAVVYDVGRNPTTYAARQSPPLYVNGVVLNGSQGVRFTVQWAGSHVTNNTVYFFARRTGTTSWKNASTGGGLLKNGSYSGTVITNPGTTLDAPYWGLTAYWGAVASLDVTTNPWGLNNQKGCAVIQLKDAWGTTGNQLKLIFDAIKAGALLDPELYFYNNANFFGGYIGIETINGISGTIDVGLMGLWLMAFDMGARNTDGRNFSVISNGNSSNGAVIQCPLYAGAAQYAVFYKCNFVGATIQEGSAGLTGFWGGMQTFIGDGKFKNCKLHIGNINLPTIDTLNNSILFAAGLICSIQSTGYTNPFILNASTIRIDNDYYEQHYKEVQMFSTSNFCLDVRFSNSVNKKSHTFLDCVFNKIDSNYNILSTYDYPYEVIWYSAQLYLLSHGNQQIYVEHSFNSKVIDSTGNPIVDAVIKIHNKNGLQHTLTTNASGDTMQQIIRTIEITANPDNIPANGQSGAAYRINNSLAPFTITVEKPGFVTETYNLPSLTTKLNWVIVLNEVVPPKPEISGVAITDCTQIGTADGQIQITAESGTQPYEYSLNGIFWQESNVFADLAAGTYQVYVKDANGNQDNLSGVKITEPVYQYLHSLPLNAIVRRTRLQASVRIQPINAIVSRIKIKASVIIQPIQSKVSRNG